MCLNSPLNIFRHNTVFPCGRLSWLSVSFLLHVKCTVSYRSGCRDAQAQWLNQAVVCRRRTATRLRPPPCLRLPWVNKLVKPIVKSQQRQSMVAAVLEWTFTLERQQPSRIQRLQSAFITRYSELSNTPEQLRLFNTIGPLTAAQNFAVLLPTGCVTCCIVCRTGVHSCRLNSVLRTDSTAFDHGWVDTRHPPRTAHRTATLPLECCCLLVVSKIAHFRWYIVLDETYSRWWRGGAHPGLGFT